MSDLHTERSEPTDQQAIQRFAGSLSEGLESAVAAFQRDGVLWIRDLFRRERICRLASYYNQHYASLEKEELEQRHAMVGDQRYMITASIKGPLNSTKLYANKTLMPLLRRLLGNRLIISSFGSVIAYPGADAQRVHFDYPPLFDEETTCVSLPPHAITLVIPLVDLTEQTGSTAVWLGSHTRIGARRELEGLVASGSYDGSVTPLPKMGDAFLMDFRTIHAGTPNRSDSPRPILYIVYSREWFREDLNFSEQPAINISAKQLGKVPRKHRHLFSAARF